MFADIWKVHLSDEKTAMEILRTQITSLDTQIAKLLDRILKTDTKIIVQKYEAKLAQLEAKKAGHCVKIESRQKPSKTFEGLLELSRRLLANPYKIWENANYAIWKQTLRLVLAEPFCD